MKKVWRTIVSIVGKKDKYYWVILVLGCLARLFYLGNIPGNTAVFADEAVSAYDAYSILHYGFDMNGYHMPVYLVSWGDGTSIMQPYLMMPFIALMGLNALSIRLPQAILGCLSIPFFYYIAKKIRPGVENENFALLAMFLFSIMPWHVMMSRWALDCNMVVPFLVFATASLIKSTEDARYLPLTAFLFGGCLYCYALPWIVMPIIVFGSVIYLIMRGKIRLDKSFVFSFLILSVMVLPLFLFILVNGGLVDEIRTTLFSVPRIPNYRTNELSLSPKQMLTNFSNAIYLFIQQDDGRVSDVTPLYGLYYKFSGIPILIGMGVSARTMIKEKNKNPLEVLIWIQLFAGVLLGSIMKETMFSRINIIHVPLTYFLAVGTYAIVEFVGEHAKWCVVFVYSVAFFAFFTYYITIHDQKVAQVYGDGMRYAMEEVTSDENKGIQVHVLSGINYGLYLYYTSFPTDVFVNTVEYEIVDDDLEPVPIRCEGVDFSGKKVLDDPPALYICGTDDSDSLLFMRKNNMTINTYTSLAVGKWNGK